jgi:hypothetical protein
LYRIWEELKPTGRIDAKAVLIMPKDLILNSLEIQRFRCFRELRIGHLGRVNLIVGKNNVGKSTILEALRLFAKPGSFRDLLEILSTRNEVFANELFAVDELSGRSLPFLPVNGLFFGRKASPGEESAIRIGPVGSQSEALRIALHVSHSPSPPFSVSHPVGPYKPLIYEATSGSYESVRTLLFGVGAATRWILAGVTTFERPTATGDNGNLPYPDADSFKAPIRDIPFSSLGPDGLSGDAITRFWDDISLSSLEKHVIGALRIISPEIERVAMKGPGGRIDRVSQAPESANRVPFAKVESFEEPIPLRALGDGVNRLFGLALALVHAKDGLFLVDEIENGIHYSVQPDLWRLVFEMATRLKVQVFATTHSYDCVKAFEEAARENEEEGVLVRLARKGDRTLVGEFDEGELKIAVEGEIEVR